MARLRVDRRRMRSNAVRIKCGYRIDVLEPRRLLSSLPAYSANADPTTEGFTSGNAVGSSTTAPLANDQGHAAWSISGTSQNSQLAYFSGGLSPSVKSQLSAQGF